MPDPIERDPDPIPTWQRLPPEADGIHIGVDAQGHLALIEAGTTTSGNRYSRADGVYRDVHAPRWWLAPALDLPPLPTSEEA